MTDRPEGDGSQAHEAAPAAPRASSAKRGVKTSHLVWGATAALVAIAAVVGGLQAADDAPGVQLVGWRGGWHQGGRRAGTDVADLQRPA